MSLSGELTRDAAREAARRELSRQEYGEVRPSLPERVIGWLVRELGKLLQNATTHLGSGAFAQLLLVGALALVVAVVLLRVGPLGREPRRRQLFGAGPALTAAQHRAAAGQSAADGRWADAVRERLRALVRELESRGVLDAQPGRTAGEVARDGGAALPDLAGDLQHAASVFEQVWYGGRPADRASYDVLVAVDDKVARALVAA